jgi:uncharacterized protein (DUF433 family)
MFKPCIRGARYPAENVLEWLASGMTLSHFLSTGWGPLQNLQMRAVWVRAVVSRLFRLHALPQGQNEEDFVFSKKTHIIRLSAQKELLLHKKQP